MRVSTPPRCAALLVADLAVLVFARPDTPRLLAHVRHPYEWVAREGTNGAAAQLAQLGLWLCSAWVLIAVLTVAGSRLPGAAGQLSAALAGRAVPALLRRAVAGSIGMSVLVSPLVAYASPINSGPVPAGTTSARQTSLAAALVARSSVGRADRALGDGSVPWPSSPRTGGPTSPTSKPNAPKPPVPTGAPAKSGAPIGGEVVVVRPGDSLWAIAAHRLGADHSAARIAAETRRWYDANAHTIGSDPGLIHPGQHLHRPEEKGASS